MEKLSLPVPESEKVIASPSASTAVEVKRVVPVAVPSEKELASSETANSIASLTSVTENVNSDEEEEVPSEAVRINVYEV